MSKCPITVLSHGGLENGSFYWNNTHNCFTSFLDFIRDYPDKIQEGHKMVVCIIPVA